MKCLIFDSREILRLNYQAKAGKKPYSKKFG